MLLCSPWPVLSCFPPRLLLFPCSRTGAGSGFALPRHRRCGCPRGTSLFILGAVCAVLAASAPPGSLPPEGISARTRVLLPSGSKCQAVAPSPPWTSRFVCAKPNRRWEGTYTNGHSSGLVLSSLCVSGRIFKPVDCSHRSLQASHSSAIPQFLICLLLPMPISTSALSA